MRRTIRNGGIRLKHLNQSGRFPSGNPRYYYRPPGQKGIPMPDLPIDHRKFLKAYLGAESGEPSKTRGGFLTGSIGSGIEAYQASDTFLGLSSATRDLRRRALEKLKTKYGKGKIKTLKPRHIRQDINDFSGNPAVARWKVWRALGKWWEDAGLLDIDPARPVRKPKAEYQGGHKAWDRDAVDKYRQYWPYNTPQRLAFELMHRTCASIADACRLGPGMVKYGWLTYQRGKSKSEAVVPFHISGPEWFESDGHLAECLKHAPNALTYLATNRGLPRSPKSATQWFSKSCTDAGLPDLAAHGIRKYRAAVFKENGARKEQRMAVMGHETEAEAANYSRTADLKKVITGTESSNSIANVGKQVRK